MWRGGGGGNDGQGETDRVLVLYEVRDLQLSILRSTNRYIRPLPSSVTTISLVDIRVCRHDTHATRSTHANCLEEHYDRYHHSSVTLPPPLSVPLPVDSPTPSQLLHLVLIYTYERHLCLKRIYDLPTKPVAYLAYEGRSGFTATIVSSLRRLASSHLNSCIWLQGARANAILRFRTYLRLATQNHTASLTRRSLPRRRILLILRLTRLL